IYILQFIVGYIMLLTIKKEVTDFNRLKQILNVLLKYEFGYLIKNIRLGPVFAFHKHAKKYGFKKVSGNPQRLRLAFEELGGTFIKLGQLISLRPDLVTKEYSEEFSKLQDEVKPFPFNQAKRIIESELGRPIGKLFERFNQNPIASASIGQVYEAWLKSGERVAVKVKRPNINKLIYTDIHLLSYLAKLIKQHYKQSIVDPIEIVKEFQKYTIKELDYVREGKVIEKFYSNFKDDRITKIPKVYWDYTTNNVLTMEFIDGIKVSDIKKLDRLGYNKKKIAKNLADSLMKQVFIHGFFHADPHPGNILVLKNNSIALLDFGINGHLDEQLKDQVSEMLLAMIGGDVNKAADSLVDLGFIDQQIDMPSLKNELEELFDDYKDMAAKYINISKAFSKIITIAKKYNIKLPVNFILLGKGMMTVESTCALLDPDVNFAEISQPMVKKLIYIRSSPAYLIKKTLKYSSKLDRFFTSLPDQMEAFLMHERDSDKVTRQMDYDIKSLTSEMNRFSYRFVFGIVFVGLVIGGAMLMQYGDEKILSIPKYSFGYFAIAVFVLLVLLGSFFRQRRIGGD
ncbi:hypothetical protein A3K72_00080, partial [Candidatus Woesearchaeota archaeon RBG_13_36_6]